MKKTTDWKEFIEGGRLYRIRATYGIDYEFGARNNQAAYFSIKGEIDEKLGSHWREDSCGNLYKEIAKHFPELAPLIKWDLTVLGEGPLHYEANALWWWSHNNSPYALGCFRLTVVSDFDADSNSIPAFGSSEEQVRAWLRARLPALLAAFESDMKAAGVL